MQRYLARGQVATITASSQLTEMSGDQLCCLIACTMALTAITAAISPATTVSQFVLFLMTHPRSVKRPCHDKHA